IPEKKGKRNAKKSLLSIRGLLCKINQSIIISWLVAFMVMGIAYGSIYGDMQTFLESNEMMKQMFYTSNVSIETSFKSMIMIVIVNKLFSEENKLHLRQIYPTKVTRSRIYWTNIGLAFFSSVLGVLVASLSLGVTAINVMEGHGEMQLIDFLAAGYNFLPAILFFTSLATLAFGWAPKLGKIAYAYLGYTFALNYFGGTLDLPEWLSKTAILNWLPQMPKENFDIFSF